MRLPVLLPLATLGALLLLSACHSDENDGTGFDLSGASVGHHGGHHAMDMGEDLPDIPDRPDPALSGFEELSGGKHRAAMTLDDGGSYSGRPAFVLPPPSPSARAHIAPVFGSGSAPMPPLTGAANTPRHSHHRP